MAKHGIIKVKDAFRWKPEAQVQAEESATISEGQKTKAKGRFKP
jgi:hypothetical protein